MSLMREMDLIVLYPDMVTYVSILKGFCDAGRLDEACGLVKAMKEHGCVPKAVAYSTILDSSKVTFTTILDGLCKDGHVEEAHKVVGKFNGDELYSLFVVSLMRAGKDSDSEKVFRMMISHGMRPSGFASSSVVKMAVSKGRVLDGFLLFEAVEKLGDLAGVDYEVYSILLDVFCRENHSAEAARVVNVMVGRNVWLKSSCVENIVEQLNGCGEYDLALGVLSIKCVNSIVLLKKEKMKG